MTEDSETKLLVALVGLEPPTYRLGIQNASHISHYVGPHVIIVFFTL